MEKDTGIKRYNLVLPVSEIEAVRALARLEGDRIKTVLLRFIRFGIEAQKTVNRGGEVIISENGRETKVIL